MPESSTRLDKLNRTDNIKVSRVSVARDTNKQGKTTMKTTKTKWVFETPCGEYRVEGGSYKECRRKANALLEVSGPRGLKFEEVGGNREFAVSLYENEDYYTDAAGRKYS